MNRVNILVIDNSSEVTGAFKSITSVSKELLTQFNFYFTLSSTSLINDLNKNVQWAGHLPFLEIQKNWRLLLYFPVLLLNTYRLKKIIKKNNIRIVHVNDLYNMCGVLLKIFNPRIKLVYHVRLLPTSYVKKLYFIWKRLLERYADEIICVSETVASNFSNEKTTVVFDSIVKSSTENVTSAKSTNNTFTILFLANYVSGKGHLQAIKAYQQALPKLGNTKLVFYGGTLNKRKNLKFKKCLVNYAGKLDIADNIQFNSFAQQPEQEILKADLMLNFSESESFSMTTLEALVYGTPIIVTDCGGPSEIIEDGKSGILVPINNINAMASAIEKMTNNKELRELMSKNGKKRVNEKFDFKNQVNLLKMIYNRLQ